MPRSRNNTIDTRFHLRILGYAPIAITMDFRSLDRMGDTDESILDEPYRPFYNIFASKPVLVKQYDAPVYLSPGR